MDFTYKFYNTTVSAWEGMRQAINAAQKSIHWEIFTLLDDLSGQPFVDLLCAKAQAGLEVKLITDAIGSYDLSREATTRLKNAGVDFLNFNSIRPGFSLLGWWRRVWHRTHRKVLVIDQELAFIGGVNISDESADWNDLHLKLTGKIARHILSAFAGSYVRAGGEQKNIEHLSQSNLLSGLTGLQEKINFIFNAPARFIRKSPFKTFYKEALDMAQESFNLLTPYYVPDKEFLEQVANAKKRGVKVNIILPWKTDMPFLQRMAELFYGVSAKMGADFYFLNKMNHGKAVSVDNKLGMVGSANLTARSFYVDSEAGVTFTDQQMVGDLNSILDNWKKESVPMVDFGANGKRGWYGRFKDWWMRKLRNYV